MLRAFEFEFEFDSIVTSKFGVGELSNCYFSNTKSSPNLII